MKFKPQKGISTYITVSQAYVLEKFDLLPLEPPWIRLLNRWYGVEYYSVRKHSQSEFNIFYLPYYRVFVLFQVTKRTEDKKHNTRKISYRL